MNDLIRVDKADLPGAVHLVEERGGVLLTVCGADERSRGRGFGLYYVFSFGKDGGFATLATTVDEDDPTFPSVTPFCEAAHWDEREIADLLGVVPLGHPDPRPLVLPDDWPEGLFPLRKDFPAGERPPLAAAREYPFTPVGGEGVFQVPVGPVHAGIIESGHFRFHAVGERIISLEARLFYNHRGVEKLAEGRRVEEAMPLVERICGSCSCSHAVAYAQGLENLGSLQVPPRAAALRTIYLELERLYNHFNDIGAICAGTGFSFGSNHGARLKEEVLRLNETLTENRYLFGAIRPGGVCREPSALAVAGGVLSALKRDWSETMAVILDNESFRERLRDTGRLSLDAARRLGVVGPAARASGVDRDLRRDHPYAAYAGLNLIVPGQREGDVEARFLIRVKEVSAAFALLAEVLTDLPAGEIHSPLGELPPYTPAFGYTESPRGANVHFLLTAPGNRIYRYRVRSASFPNWAAVPFAVEGNMIPDFPLINKSFELCYACLDR